MIALGSLARLATASDRALLTLGDAAAALGELTAILGARVELAVWHLRRGR